MTRQTTAEAAAVLSGEAPGGTEWDSIRGYASDGGSTPPDSEQIWRILKNAARSLPPSSESIASPTDMDPRCGRDCRS